MIHADKRPMMHWIILISVAVLLGSLVGIILPQENKDRNEFMTDCLKHEPWYSCSLKWKQMHPDPVVVVAPFNK
jgi:hypothetical protein